MRIFKNISVLPFDRIYVVLFLFKSFRVYFYLPYFVIINNLRYAFAYNIVGVTLTKFS